MKKIMVGTLILMLLTSVMIPAIGINIQPLLHQDQNPNDNLVAHWKFDEASGYKAHDSSGNGYHGTVTGATWTTGKVDGALEFDGTNDFVQVTENTTQFHSYLETVGKGSIAFWFKCDYIPITHGIAPMFYYGDLSPCTNMFDAANKGLIIELGHSPVHPGSERLYFTIFANGCTLPSFCYDSWNSIKEGEWYHYVAVVGEDYNTGYLNGVEMVDRNYNFGNSGYSQFFEDAVSHEVSWIGRGYWDAKNDPTPNVYFDGEIDDVRIYDEPLTAHEILELYNIGADANLVGNWKFDENGGNIAYDSTENEFHAAVKGGASWVKGMRSYALEFDGENDYVDMPQEAVEYIGELSQGTISFWFNFTNILQNQKIIPLFYIGIDNENDDDDLFIVEIGHGGTKNTKLYVTWIINQQIPVLCYDTGFNLNEHQWYHFAVVVGPDGNTGYLDGEELENRHYNFGKASDDLFLDDIPVKEKLSVAYGKTNDMIDPKFRYFEGMMDDVRIYDRPLNDSEIYNLYIENVPPYEPSNPNPANGSTNVNISKNISWDGEDPDNDPVMYDVYFGVNNTPPLVAENNPENIYNPAFLDYNTTYYWRIVAWDDHGHFTEGALWQFTTEIQGNKPPETPKITGPSHGNAGVEYDYTFVSIDPNGDDVYYYVQWGDSCGSQEWVGPYPSGQDVTLNHTYHNKGTFTISAKAVDIYNAESNWGSLTVTMPRNKATQSLILHQILELLVGAFQII